jgi:hypothetical protein
MKAPDDKTRQPPSAGPATKPGGSDAAPSTGATGTDRRANADDDDEDEWRHEPVAPVDERNPLKSLGRAIVDVATSRSGPAPKPKRPDR